MSIEELDDEWSVPLIALCPWIIVSFFEWIDRELLQQSKRPYRIFVIFCRVNCLLAYLACQVKIGWDKLQILFKMNKHGILIFYSLVAESNISKEILILLSNINSFVT